MKIVCFSDVHGIQDSHKLTDWFMANPADILLFAGDIQRSHADDGTSFVNWLSHLPYTHKLCTFGNHDTNYKDMLETAKLFPSVTFLNHEPIEVMGLKIFGSPYSRVFMNWAFMLHESALWERYKEIPNDTDILITHTPPLGTLDANTSGFNCGSEALMLKLLHMTELKLHVFGHIHEGAGMVKDKYTSINASVLDEKYKLKHMPTIVELP